MLLIRDKISKFEIELFEAFRLMQFTENYTF